MARWAVLIVLALGGWIYLADDPVPVLRTAAELGGVIGLFTLVSGVRRWPNRSSSLRTAAWTWVSTVQHEVMPDRRRLVRDISAAPAGCVV
jgi:hypothetical protein